MQSYIFIHLDTVTLQQHTYLSGIGVLDIVGVDIVDQLGTYIFPHQLDIHALSPEERQLIHQLAPRFESVAKRLYQLLNNRQIVTLSSPETIALFNQEWINLGIPAFEIQPLTDLLRHVSGKEQLTEIANHIQLIHFDSAKEITDRCLQHHLLLQEYLKQYPLDVKLVTLTASWRKQIQHLKPEPALYKLIDKKTQEILSIHACTHLSNDILKFTNAMLPIPLDQVELSYSYTGSYYLAEILRLEQVTQATDITPKQIQSAPKSELIVLNGDMYHAYTVINIHLGLVSGYAMGNSLKLLSQPATLSRTLIPIKTNAQIQNYLGTLLDKKLRRITLDSTA